MTDTINTGSRPPVRAQYASNEEDAEEFQDDLNSGKFVFDKGQARVAAAAAEAVAENVTPGTVTAKGKGAKGTSGVSKTDETGTVVDAMRIDLSGEAATHKAASALPSLEPDGSLSLPDS